jgi:DNA-binding NarL/FixJ family response regulator
MTKRIRLAEGSPIVGRALDRPLATEANCERCAQAANALEAISLAKQSKPDWVVLDLSMQES